jgi:hypothetical protein
VAVVAEVATLVVGAVVQAVAVAAVAAVVAVAVGGGHLAAGGLKQQLAGLLREC